MSPKGGYSGGAHWVGAKEGYSEGGPSGESKGKVRGGGGPLKVSPQAYKGFKVKKKNSVFGPLSKIPGSSLVAH